MKEPPKFLTSIAKIMNVSKPDKKMDLCLSLIETLVDSRHLKIADSIVESGLILRVIQTAIETKKEGSVGGSLDKIDEKGEDAKGEGGGKKGEIVPPPVAIEAVHLLKKGIISKSQKPEEEKARAKVRTVINNLLTPGIYLMLQYDEKGVEKVATHLRSA